MTLTSFRAALTGAALVACGLLAVPTAASAAPPTPPPGIDQRAVPAAEAAAASSYWTAERMRAAIPADVLLAGKTASTPARPRARTESSAVRVLPSVPARRSLRGSR